MAITWNDPIKTYFTAYDIQHMKQVQPQIDLGDYTSVKDNAVFIYPRVEDQSMPPGSPWSAEWIANFKAWIEAGYPET
jgi:hypothetical protein